MRQGQQNKRMRGRNRKGPNPLTRSYESNGPDVKIRGTALHIAEKYVQLARDAQSSGDRVAAESYLQHAEHYFRIVAAAQAQMPQQQQQPQQSFRSDGDDFDDDEDSSDGSGDRSFPQQGGQPSFGLTDPQPYVNGNGQGPVNGEGGGNGGDDNRPDFRENRDQREGRDQGGYRGRRRRPYRDRSAGDQSDFRGGDAPRPSLPPEADANNGPDEA
jgi:Domain of unknown function (DUF4167)